MCFGGALQRILGQVLTAEPRIRPVYLNKLDLQNAYMTLLVIMEKRPVHCLPRPQEKPQQPAADEFSPLPPHGVCI